MYTNSFFPNAVRENNQLSIDLRQSTSTNTLKSKLIKLKKSNVPPKYYNTVPRYSQIHDARMQMESSNLNDYMLNRFIKEDPSCECVVQTENPKHYLLFCPKYSGQRKKSTDKLEVLDLPPESNLSNILLEGNPELPETKNKDIFEAVAEFSFFTSTKRFSK